MLQTVKTELSRWRDAVRAHFDPRQPPVVGWQLPFLGCGVSLGLRGPRWLEAQARRFNAPFTLYAKGQRITVSQDPEFMLRLYTADVDEVSFFAGLKTFPAFDTVIPLGASGPEGANLGVEMLRKFLAARVMGSTAELDEEVARALHEALASGRGELLQVARRAVLRITARLLLGARFADDPAFIDALCDLDEALLRLLRQLSSREPLAQGMAARTRALAPLRAELLRRRAEGYTGEPRDCFDAFLVLRRPDGEGLSDEVIASELVGYMFATIANTHAGAAMCALHILHDAALHRRVVAEQDACRREHGETITTAALKDMPLLNACYQETLRLYASMLQLRMTLQAMRVGAYELPARSLIAFSPYLLHRDPAVYSDPELFDPDRFLAGPRGPARAPSNSHYLPYGRGVHACIGRHLARQEIMLTVARLLRDFEVRLEGGKHPLAVDWLTNGLAAPAGPRVLQVRPREAPAS
jgi:cytochrome P450